MNIYRDIPDRATLEREYSPSSRIGGNLGPLLTEYAARSAAARARSPGFRTLPYGPDPAETLDYFPAPSVMEGGPPRPVMAYIHGGYWQELSKNEHSFPAPDFARRDMGYVAINYGLAPAATVELMVSRCRLAIAWLVVEADALGIDRASLHLSGCSAGGHLAAMSMLADWTRYGIERNPLRSVTLLSGVFDLRPIPLTYVNDAVRMSADDALRMSPLLLVDVVEAELPPALIAYGANETAEFKRQSAEFGAAISRRGVTAAVEEIPERNHFDLVFDLGRENTRFGSLVAEHIGHPRATESRVR